MACFRVIKLNPCLSIPYIAQHIRHMHFHHYTLLQLNETFLASYQGERVVSAFSQSKNELILELETIYLRVGCRTPLTYIVPADTFAKARKNVVDLMEPLMGLSLQGGYVVPQERVWVLQWEDDYQLIFKMHNLQANVMLRHEGKIIDLFNHEHEEDWQFEEAVIEAKEQDLPTQVAPSEAAVLTALREISPIYEKYFARRALALMQEGFPFAQAFSQLKSEASSDQFFIHKEPKKIKFYLFPPHTQEQVIAVRGVVEALQVYLRCHFQYEGYRIQHKITAKELGKPAKKYRKVLDSYQRNIAQLESERNPEEIGHLLMANLHAIPPESKKVVLDDFYTDESISIKLDPQLSPQDNAKRYYEKHKQRKLKLAYLKEQLSDIEGKWLEAETALEGFQALPHPQDLPMGPKGFDMNQLKAMKQYSRQLMREVKSAEDERVPYRQFKLEGFEIFVGRNARNNDELSFKFANKHDLWLHAKDVSGSHVVIRHRAGKDLPPHVLEYAAQLAAFYSKRKHDTLVPVLYTPRKYIRKRKGDPPGLVAVDREQVIMVEPIREVLE